MIYRERGAFCEPKVSAIRIGFAVCRSCRRPVPQISLDDFLQNSNFELLRYSGLFFDRSRTRDSTSECVLVKMTSQLTTSLILTSLTRTGAPFQVSGYPTAVRRRVRGSEGPDQGCQGRHEAGMALENLCTFPQ